MELWKNQKGHIKFFTTVESGGRGRYLSGDQDYQKNYQNVSGTRVTPRRFSSQVNYSQ